MLSRKKNLLEIPDDFSSLLLLLTLYLDSSRHPHAQNMTKQEKVIFILSHETHR